jgi:hypothetical protein
VPVRRTIYRLLRMSTGVLSCAALGPSCLLEFPERRQASGDAGTADATADIGTIEQDRFDWPRFAAYGLVAGPDGDLHPIHFVGSTDDDRQLTVGTLTFDGISADPAMAQTPRSLGGGAFEVRLPSVGSLPAATVVLTRDDASGLGVVRLESPPGWGGPIVLTRLLPTLVEDRVYGPYPTRLVGLGGPPDTPRASIRFGAFGSESFTVEAGTPQDAIDPARRVNVGVNMLPDGRFRVLDTPWGLQGAWFPALQFFVSHRLSAVSPEGSPDEGLAPLGELWFGVPTADGDLGPRELAGRWQLSGLRVNDGRWVGFGAVLEVANDLDQGAYALRSDPGGFDEAGHIDLPAEPELPFEQVVAFNPDGAPDGRWFAIGSQNPPMLVLWGTDGIDPQPRLLFGLRED